MSNTPALDLEYRKVIPGKFVTKRDGSPMHCVACGKVLALGETFAATSDAGWHSYCSTCAASATAQIGGLVNRIDELVESLNGEVPLVVTTMVEAATPLIERALAGDEAAFLPAKSVLMGVREQIGIARKATTAATNTQLEPGLYVVGPDGEWSSYWLVRPARGGGHVYAMRLVAAPTAGRALQWDYIKGGLGTVRRGRRATAQEAADLGHASHHCAFCGLELTDDGEGRSVEVGYGPICAKKYGLPWGVV